MTRKVYEDRSKLGFTVGSKVKKTLSDERFTFRESDSLTQKFVPFEKKPFPGPFFIKFETFGLPKTSSRSMEK